MKKCLPAVDFRSSCRFPYFVGGLVFFPPFFSMRRKIFFPPMVVTEQKSQKVADNFFGGPPPPKGIPPFKNKKFFKRIPEKSFSIGGFCSDRACPSRRARIMGTREPANAEEQRHPKTKALSENDRQISAYAQRMIEEGRQIFRFDTFGSEAFWGDALQLHKAIAGEKNGGVGGGVSPKTALSVGLKVDTEALPAELVAQIKAGRSISTIRPPPSPCSSSMPSSE